MATVHIGRLIGPVGFARTVAIKRLHAHFSSDPDFVSMFLDEARLAARIRHPNVVPTLDVVTLEGELFLVMDYVQGESLASILRNTTERKELVPPNIAVAIVSSALHGLHAAHIAKSEQGVALHIVHRDVSPQNIIVGSDGIARVLDFGIAKAVGRLHTTRDGAVKGKVGYMSPEQLRAQDVDARTDVYAASVVLWEVLCGRRLFAAESAEATMLKVLDGASQLPSDISPAVTRELDAVVMKGLSRSPAARYASAQEMALALESVSATLPASQISAWLQTVAAEHLRVRAHRIAEIESSSPLPVATAQTLLAAELPTETTAAVTPSRKRRATPRMRVAFAALGVGAVVTTVWVLRGGPSPTTTVAPEERTPAPSSEPTRAATQAAAPKLLVEARPAVVSATASATASPGRKPPAHPRGTASAAVSCDPPYTVDARGFQVPKPECFK